MFIWIQKTGELYHDGKLIATGYSGHQAGKNNPAMQSLYNIGPIPCGEWEICGPPIDTAEHGPFVLRLEPAQGTRAFGRVGFLIHGDSLLHPGAASEGCIILPRAIRETIWKSEDRCLYVLPAKPLIDENSL